MRLWLMHSLCRWQGGLLPVVGTLKLEDAESVTFAQLRPRIELKDDSGMIR